MTDDITDDGMTEDETPVIVEAAATIYKALRTLCDQSMPPISISAPVARQVLENLNSVDFVLPQVLDHLAAGLEKSLETREVQEYEGRNPVQSIVTATDHLTHAATLAKQLGVELEQARNAISPRASEPDKLLTVSIPLSMHKELKAFCVEADMTMKQAVMRGISSEMASIQNQEKP